MLRRIMSLILLAWALGFAWFAGWLAQPAGQLRTDAVVVLTGGAGRVDRGLAVLRQGMAPTLFVSGVDHTVKPREFAAEFGVTAAQMSCCVQLGYRASDTAGNAAEVADWLDQNRARSIRLVTSDWHMRRAVMELHHAIPAGTVIIEDAVPSKPTLRVLFNEYHKLIARWIALRVWG